MSDYAKHNWNNMEKQHTKKKLIFPYPSVRVFLSSPDMADVGEVNYEGTTQAP